MSIVGSRTRSTIRPWELLSNFAGTVPRELLFVNRERVDKERQSGMGAWLTFAMMLIRHVDG
jgi:hypothetical protein